jgi:hypothetical protein
MKKILFVLILAVFASADIVNTGAGSYMTGGLPGADSAVIAGSGAGAWMTGGLMGGDSVAAAGTACDSNLHWMDTTKVWADAIAARCSLVCDSGKVVFQYATDTAGTISRDSVTGKDSPYLYTDTTGDLTPSTAYFLRFVFDADTGTGVDTTLWYSYDTRDSSDTSEYWLYTAPSPRDTTGTWWKKIRRSIGLSIGIGF